MVNAKDTYMIDAPDGQIVLEEEVDENYEPSEEEILEYAQWLGRDPIKEKASEITTFASENIPVSRRTFLIRLGDHVDR